MLVPCRVYSQGCFDLIFLPKKNQESERMDIFVRPLPHRPLCRNHHAPASEVATNYTQEMGVPKLPIEHCLLAFQTNPFTSSLM